MKELLYYPSFEVQSLDWLKFALLYIDELRPIIPRDGDKYLSEEYSKIVDGTGLINPYRPEFTDGTRATLDAIDIVENILREPSRYSSLLGSPHFVEEWRDERNHKYTIFEQKYTPEWRAYCLHQRLGTSRGDNIIVAKSLGLLYMTLLTNVISEKMGLSTITDYQKLDNISILARCQLPTDDKINVARGIVNLYLPKNIKNISCEKIRKYRLRKEFKERLHAFHSAFDKYVDALERGEVDRGFLDMDYEPVKEFYLDMAMLGIDLEVFAYSLWLVIKNPENYPAAIISGLTGTKILLSASHKINKYWGHSKDTRLTRKYYNDLSELK